MGEMVKAKIRCNAKLVNEKCTNSCVWYSEDNDECKNYNLISVMTIKKLVKNNE